MLFWYWHNHVLPSTAIVKKLLKQHNTLTTNPVNTTIRHNAHRSLKTLLKNICLAYERIVFRLSSFLHLWQNSIFWGTLWIPGEGRSHLARRQGCWVDGKGAPNQGWKWLHILLRILLKISETFVIHIHPAQLSPLFTVANVVYLYMPVRDRAAHPRFYYLIVRYQTTYGYSGQCGI